MLPPWIDRRFGIWIKGHELHDIALVLALVPLILPLPVISLMMFVLAGDRVPWRDHLRRWRFVLLTAICNVILSAWILSVISTGLIALVFDWWASMLDLLPQTAPQPQSSPAISA
jgi:hypothetical protein